MRCIIPSSLSSSLFFTLTKLSAKILLLSQRTFKTLLTKNVSFFLIPCLASIKIFFRMIAMKTENKQHTQRSGERRWKKCFERERKCFYSDFIFTHSTTPKPESDHFSLVARSMRTFILISACTKGTARKVCSPSYTH